MDKGFTFYFPEVAMKPEPSIRVELTSAGREVDRYTEGDCTIRAIATFLGLPYREVKDMAIKDYGYTPRRGMPLDYFQKFAKDFGLTFVQKAVRLNSQSAREKLPKKAILLFREHVAAYEDGTIFDVFRTTNVAGCKQTKGYFYLPE